MISVLSLVLAACGSDDETGWSEDAAYDEVQLPVDDDWPVGASPGKRRKAISTAIAILMIVLMLILLLAQ